MVPHWRFMIQQAVAPHSALNTELNRLVDRIYCSKFFSHSISILFRT